MIFIRMYHMLPFIVMIVLLLINIIIFMSNSTISIIVFFIMLSYLFIVILSYRAYSKYYLKEKLLFAKNLYKFQDKFLQEMNIPYAIISESNLLLANNAFAKIFCNNINVKPGIKLVTIFPYLSTIIKDMIANNKVFHYITYKNRIYKIELNHIKNRLLLKSFAHIICRKGELFFSISFYDNTELIKYKNESADKSIVIGLIYIDNFDEIMEEVDDVNQSYAISIIDREIVNYIYKYNGICKKIEKDKYFIVMTMKTLVLMEKDKFSIIKLIRVMPKEINVIPTISIGIGTGVNSYKDCYRYSRMAIDIAISRGGNQAAIKDGVDIRYYGSTNEKETKYSRIKSRVKAESLKALLLEADNVFIMGHQHIDFDALGAAIGIYCIARTLGQQSKIILDNKPTFINNLIDIFAKNNSDINNMFVNSSIAINNITQHSLLVIVDTNKPSIVECEKILDNIKNIVIIDHHINSKDSFFTNSNIKLLYCEPYASSTCEMVTELIRYISDDIKLTELEANSMYAGIIVDTNNFSVKTGVRTFESAAYLKRNGANPMIVRKFFRDDINLYNIKAEIIRRTTFYKNCYAISMFASSNIDNPYIVSAKVANELLNISNVKASFVCICVDGIIYLSARSIDDVNVQIIVEQLGGGGHITIAGAQLKGMSLIEVEKKIMDAIDKNDR